MIDVQKRGISKRTTARSTQSNDVLDKLNKTNQKSDLQGIYAKMDKYNGNSLNAGNTLKERLQSKSKYDMSDEEIIETTQRLHDRQSTNERIRNDSRVNRNNVNLGTQIRK